METRKRSRVETDEEYLPEPFNKHKPLPARSVGRPRGGRERYQFSEDDNSLIMRGITEYGKGWVAIAREYFSHCKPKVTGKDIDAYVKTQQELTRFAIKYVNY